jgi:aryl-alcohol dehydrogenase-like predicted oxidoreductase
LTPVEQTLDAMKREVDAGRVRAWGVSNYAAWQILEMNHLAAARSLAAPVVSQVLYNVLHRQLDIEYFAFTKRFPIHTTVFNPLAGGLLAGKYRRGEAPSPGSRFDDNALYQRRYYTPAMLERVEQLRAVAASEGMTMVALAYAWVAARPGVDSILVGPASVQQLDDAVEAVGHALSGAALARIDELSREWNGTDTSYVR